MLCESWLNLQVMMLWRRGKKASHFYLAWVNEISINTAAADWDVEESGEYEQFVLDAWNAAVEEEEEENVDELRGRRFLEWLNNGRPPTT